MMMMTMMVCALRRCDLTSNYFERCFLQVLSPFVAIRQSSRLHVARAK